MGKRGPKKGTVIPWNKGISMSEETRKKISNANKGKDHSNVSSETRLKLSNALKGKVKSKEHCQKISEKAKQRKVDINRIKVMNKAWIEKCNNNLSEEQKESIISLYLTPMNIPQVSKKAGVSDWYVKKTLKEFNIPKHPKDIKNKLMVEQNKKSKLEKYGNENYTNVQKRKKTLSEKDEQYWLTRKQKVEATSLERYGATNIFKTEEFKKEAKKTKLEKYGDEKYNNRDKYILTNKKKYGVENFSQSQEFIDKTFKFNRYKVNNTHLDSFPELCVYLYCINNNIDIKRNKCKFKYTFENKEHYCFVDFNINGKLVELKGDYLYELMLIPNTQDNAKLNCLLENHVEIWTSKIYNFYIDWFNLNNYNVKDYIV